AVAHAHAPAPIAVAAVGPVVDAAVVQKYDVVKLISGHIRTADARVRKVDVGEHVQTAPFKRPGPLPAALRVAEEAMHERFAGYAARIAALMPLKSPNPSPLM